VFFLVFLAACGVSEGREAVPVEVPGGRVSVSVSSSEVIEVSLPTYSRSEEIWQQEEDGSLVSDGSILWADEPTRGTTRELVRALSAITGKRVAGEPWPFDEPAAARVEVRVDEMLASADGQFRLTGQVFTTRRAGGRDRAEPFSITAPIDGDAGPGDIAAARGSAVRELARQIASAGL